MISTPLAVLNALNEMPDHVIENVRMIAVVVDRYHEKNPPEFIAKFTFHLYEKFTPGKHPCPAPKDPSQEGAGFEYFEVRKVPRWSAWLYPVRLRGVYALIRPSRIPDIHDWSKICQTTEHWRTNPKT